MGGGGQSVPTSSTTTQQLSPEQRAIIEPLIPIVTEFGQTPLEPFGPSLVPGFNPSELQAQNIARGTAGNVAQDVGQANVFANFLQSPQALDPATNPALQSNINAAIRPLQETFAQTILPNIRSAEVLTGQVGGSRGKLAEQGAANTLLRQVGETSSGIVGQNFSDILKLGGQSLFAQPDLATASLLPAQIIAGIGGGERGLTTAQLQEQAQRFGAEQLKAFAPAQAAIETAIGIPGGTTTTTGTSAGAAGPGALGTLSSVGTLALIGKSLFGF